MPLVPSNGATLVTNALKALNPKLTGAAEVSTKAQWEAICTALASWLATATVTTPPGVAVATAGSATNQAGATTAPGIGVIS